MMVPRGKMLGGSSGIKYLAYVRGHPADFDSWAAGGVDLELRPTFRRPHYTVMVPDLDRDLGRLSACENVRWVNPHFRDPEELP